MTVEHVESHHSTANFPVDMKFMGNSSSTMLAALSVLGRSMTFAAEVIGNRLPLSLATFVENFIDLPGTFKAASIAGDELPMNFMSVA